MMSVHITICAEFEEEWTLGGNRASTSMNSTIRILEEMLPYIATNVVVTSQIMEADHHE